MLLYATPHNPITDLTVVTEIEGCNARVIVQLDRAVGEMVTRDKNHPSVIAWSLANEPYSTRPAAKPFFRELYDLAKSLDPTRPVTVVSCLGVEEETFEFCDVMCLNRYFGGMGR